MPHSVPYHLNEGTHSLSYATPEKEELPQAEDKDRVREYDLPEEKIYCLYTKTSSSSNSDTTQAEITGSNAPIVYALQQIQNDLQTHTNFTQWKPPEFTALQKALQTIQWKQSRAEVAADLISSVVLKHPFPNGNHRTSISLAVLYLTETCPGFTIELTEDFESVTNTYIEDSKRILTVRRNSVPFRILKNAGATHIERKGGIQISLNEFDLDIEDAYSVYEASHYNRTYTYIVTLLSSAGVQEEGEHPDSGKRQFTERLRS